MVLQREGVFLLFHEDSPLSDLDYFDSEIKVSGEKKLGFRDFCGLVFLSWFEVAPFCSPN